MACGTTQAAANRAATETRDIAEDMAGKHGHDYISDNSQAAKNFVAIEAWTDDAAVDAVATVTYTVSNEAGTVTKTHTGIIIKESKFIVGNITDLNVTAGIVIAYYAKGEMA